MRLFLIFMHCERQSKQAASQLLLVIPKLGHPIDHGKIGRQRSSTKVEELSVKPIVQTQITDFFEEMIPN